MGLSTSRTRAWLLIGLIAVVAAVGCIRADDTSKRKTSTPAETDTATKRAAGEEPKGKAGDALDTGEPKKLEGISAFASAEYVDRLARKRDSDQWYGLYMRGRKAGYAEVRTRRTKPGEPGGFMGRLTATLRADNSEMVFDYVSYFEAKPPYRMVAMTTEQHSPAGKVVRHFSRANGKTKIEQIVDDKKGKSLWAPAMCDTLQVFLAQMVPNVATLRKGVHARYCTFDASKQKQETDELRVTEVGKRLIDGVAQRVATIQTKGTTESVWQTLVVADGDMLEMTFGEGMVLKLEDKKLAKSKVTGVDVTSMAIKVKKPLGNPMKIKKLKMIVKVTKGFKLPSGPNQLVSKRSDGRYDVTIQSVPGPKVTARERTEALAVTPDANWNDPAIVKLANDVSAGAKTRRDKITALNHWVYTHLRKTLTSNVTTATQVLDRRAGDCTEHSVLLVALLRALHIPAREVGGVVYDNKILVGFGWHAWVEAEIVGHWVQVDPSWDEPIANATHLKLGAGEDDEGSANMGSLAIDIVYPAGHATP